MLRPYDFVGGKIVWLAFFSKRHASLAKTISKIAARDITAITEAEHLQEDDGQRALIYIVHEVMTITYS